jgi:hypothetical protein
MLPGTIPQEGPKITRVGQRLRAAEARRRAGLAVRTGAHHEGGHWLGSFAVYLVAERYLVSQAEVGEPPNRPTLIDYWRRDKPANEDSNKNSRTEHQADCIHGHIDRW